MSPVVTADSRRKAYGKSMLLPTHPRCAERFCKRTLRHEDVLVQGFCGAGMSVGMLQH